jgi:hypothetical protein
MSLAAGGAAADGLSLDDDAETGVQGGIEVPRPAQWAGSSAACLRFFGWHDPAKLSLRVAGPTLVAC